MPASPCPLALCPEISKPSCLSLPLAAPRPDLCAEVLKVGCKALLEPQLCPVPGGGSSISIRGLQRTGGAQSRQHGPCVHRPIGADPLRAALGIPAPLPPSPPPHTHTPGSHEVAKPLVHDLVAHSGRDAQLLRCVALARVKQKGGFPEARRGGRGATAAVCRPGPGEAAG